VQKEKRDRGNKEQDKEHDKAATDVIVAAASAGPEGASAPAVEAAEEAPAAGQEGAAEAAAASAEAEAEAAERARAEEQAKPAARRGRGCSCCTRSRYPGAWQCGGRGGR
jgi:hypothetical protein